jgi:hypothetical protein
MNQVPDQPIQRYLKVSPHDLSGYWFDAYGWIACYFAQLEGLSYALIDLLESEDDRVRSMRMPYQGRTERAKGLVCSCLRERGDARLAEEWDKLLTDAEAAAPMRNKILHNPLSVSLALGDPLHDERTGIVLIHEPGRPVLKLGTVQAYAKSMLELNTRIQDLVA